MAIWTSSYQFPTIMSPNCASVQIGTEIWTFSSFMKAPTTEIVIFKTETREYAVIDCPVPAVFPDFPNCLGHCFSHGDQIYVWTRHDQRDEDSDQMLFRLDTKTLQWEYILTSSSIHVSGVILGNIMYALIVNNSIHRLETIDLARKAVVSTQLLGETEINDWLDLMSHEGRLYLVGCGRDNRRSVSIFDNGVFRVVHQDSYRINEDIKAHVRIRLSNKLFFQYTHVNNSLIGLDEFNFESNDWEKIRVEKCWLDEKISRSCQLLKIDGTIYTVLNKNSRDQEIRLLEITPNLSTICLDNIVNHCYTNGHMEDIDRFEQLIPVALKNEWDNMIRWIRFELGPKEECRIS